MTRFRPQIVFAFAVVLISLPAFSYGQFVNQAIGGVSIDANGQINALTKGQREALANTLREQLAKSPHELQSTTELRMVSLSGLQSQIADHQKRGLPLPDEVRFLAGLQRVEYLFVDPDQNDIVLAGPAEGWQVSPTGDVVGVTTGRPVILLDDLLMALRTVRAAAEVGITCSIDPTAEGRQALDSLLRRQKQFTPGITRAVEQALGQQQISISGVPTDSHFASVLVASDFRMKRLAMNLEPSPVDDMPGFLDLIKSRRSGLNNMMPRWWMACDYDSIARSEDGLSWQIRGQGVKVMTEDEIVSADGTVAQSGKVNPVAQEWSDNMSNKYDELSRHEPIFGQLRNIMDLCVVAALMEKESLMEKAGCDFSLLSDAQSSFGLEKWNVPKTVASQSSFIKKGRQYIITASGGVHVDSWSAAANTEVVSLAKQRDAANLQDGNSWRWD